MTQVNDSGGVNNATSQQFLENKSTRQTGGNIHKYNYKLSIPTGQNYNIWLIWLYKQI